MGHLCVPMQLKHYWYSKWFRTGGTNQFWRFTWGIVGMFGTMFAKSLSSCSWCSQCTWYSVTPTVDVWFHSTPMGYLQHTWSNIQVYYMMCACLFGGSSQDGYKYGPTFLVDQPLYTLLIEPLSRMSHQVLNTFLSLLVRFCGSSTQNVHRWTSIAKITARRKGCSAESHCCLDSSFIFRVKTWPARLRLNGTMIATRLCT